MTFSTTGVPWGSLTFLSVYAFWQLGGRSPTPDIRCKHEMLILGAKMFILPTTYRYTHVIYLVFPWLERGVCVFSDLVLVIRGVLPWFSRAVPSPGFMGVVLEGARGPWSLALW